MQVRSLREILAELKGRLMLASAGFGALFRHRFRRHSTSASSRPARTTARWGARSRRHGRERVGAGKSRSSPRGHRSGRAADEPTWTPGSGIPRSLRASGVTGRTRLRCGSVCTAMLASSCAGHIPMLARGGGPHIIRPASSEADAAHADLPGPARPGPRAPGRRGRPGEPGLAGHFDPDAGRHARRGPAPAPRSSRGHEHATCSRRRLRACARAGLVTSRNRVVPGTGSNCEPRCSSGGGGLGSC